ncbi:stilbene synthase [bacterium]|nr:stilbene synthase [Verrucomicrobiota bacterium]MDA7682361.1 stilbene synthase [bacterium]MDB4705672.1 stilbene synthase [Verrucomicrobiota bacterium]
MFIWSAAHAVPPNSYTQTECLESFVKSSQYGQLNPTSQILLRRILRGDNGIRTRSLALDSVQEAFNLTPDVLQHRFQTHAPALASQAASNALIKADLGSQELDAVIISTCTGYLCPGLTSYLSESLGLDPSMILLDLVGHGCGAAIPNLRNAHALIHSGQASKVLSVCVEVCSAAFYLDDDPGVLISACLFGDAAAAAVCSSRPSADHRPIETVAMQSTMRPEYRDLLRFEHKMGMLRNILSPDTPRLAAESAYADLLIVLEKEGIPQESIQTWIAHAGGKRVLDALTKKFKLQHTDLEVSRKLLEKYGNTSSPFVLMALEEQIKRNAPGGYWWMNSFGAGFSSHGILLKAE